MSQVASALLKGSLDEDEAALKRGATSSGGNLGTAAAVEASLVYLRDRVSVESLRHEDNQCRRAACRLYHSSVEVEEISKSLV